jgi:mxaL protein
MKALLPHFPHMRRRPEAWALLAALLLTGGALLRPSWPRARALHSYLMVFDISQSMNTRDQLPGDRQISRLQAAKEAARRTLLDLPCGSHASLALFTEYRTFVLFAPVEVCANFAELSAALARIDTRMSWAGASEIAKGVGFALRTQTAIEAAMPEAPLLAFFTDGHEAPPLDPRYRTRFGAAPARARGVLIGVGGDRPVPIPKTGPDGQALGFWRADDVLHDDPHNLGRGGSVQGEASVDENGGRANAKTERRSEHLSSLREPYLKQLGREAGLDYVRLIDAPQLSAALRALAPSGTARGRTKIDWMPAAAAWMVLALMLAAPLLVKRGRAR